MPAIPTIIERPLQRLGVRTPEEFRSRQRHLLEVNRRRRPDLSWSDPWLAIGAAVAYVGAGAWRVICACGEAPPADPDWQLACCSGCGAIYAGVIFPIDREAIEAVLLKRARPGTRNWRAPETVGDLVAQNVAHGEAA